MINPTETVAAADMPALRESDPEIYAIIQSANVAPERDDPSISAVAGVFRSEAFSFLLSDN